MPRGTTLRNIRINAELWHAAQTKAEAEGRSVSEVIRELLNRWGETPPPAARSDTPVTC